MILILLKSLVYLRLKEPMTSVNNLQLEIVRKKYRKKKQL